MIPRPAPQALLAAVLIALLVAGFFVPATLRAQPESSSAAGPPLPVFDIDPAHAGAMFMVRHFDVSHTQGRFNQIGGTISYDRARPEETRIEISIATASVDTNNVERDTHLRGPDYFNVREYPTMTYRSKSVRQIEGGGLRIVGDLTIKGVTREVEAELTYVGEGETLMRDYRVGADARFTLRRSDFGVGGTKGIGDDVLVIVSLEAIRR
jgi:polyisoprenoid-binding protein YceI